MKHVLDTAKRLGIPIIIMDEEGEAAQVVMPYEDFAAMVGHATPAPHKPRVVKKAKDEDEIAQALADITFERVTDQVKEAADRLERDIGVRQTDQGFLEDRFYLEPLDDEKTI